MTTLLVLAKQPRPGRVKTRLCPPCSADDAARVAEAALADTLASACGSGAERVVVALDGEPGDWLPSAVEVVGQGTGQLAERLACAWEQVTGPTLQIGMDTPQVSGAVLQRALAHLSEPHCDAVFGPATDGGWWAIGMQQPQPPVFLGIPTSRPDTGARQRARLVEVGLRVVDLAELRDVDDIDDARAVAIDAPSTRFARTLKYLGHDQTHVSVH